jgi:hypothetical protein
MEQKSDLQLGEGKYPLIRKNVIKNIAFFSLNVYLIRIELCYVTGNIQDFYFSFCTAHFRNIFVIN